MEDRYLHTLDSIPLTEIVKEEYRNYQIYTLMDRAIPYLQDGLKPGQRRILYTLWKNQSKGLMKVSSATGLVLTLHPHGPASVESAIVNLAQDYTFSNNYPLIDKKGYFGERMEPTAAASRYIECKIGEVAKLLLFDDMNQVQMVPNYDEKVVEPVCFLPKLPLMLLNGSEGIGTGFSSVIPSFHHKDIIDSMTSFLNTGKAKKLKPYFHLFNNDLDIDKSGKINFHAKFEQVGESIFMTEIPRNFDASRIYRHLSKFVESGYLKDYIDASVDNNIRIELVFKRGATPPLAEVEQTIACSTSMTPNYTLISERGVRIFDRPEEIIELFAAQRLVVVRRRYELLSEEYTAKIKQNNEVIRFIKEKHYEKATKSKNRKDFVDYLDKQKFTYCDYLADMPIYRMTLEEVEKRKLMVKEDGESLKRCDKIAKSPKLVKEQLIIELEDVKAKLTEWLKKKDKERTEKLKEQEKAEKKKVENAKRSKPKQTKLKFDDDQDDGDDDE